jgi:hypothetical protein
MKSSRIIAETSLATVMAMAVFALPACAQTNTSSPIVVKKQASSTTTRSNWMNAEVIHADSNSIVVRERQNGMMIHTFTYTPTLQARMQKVADNGGYQYGDKVKVLYQQGQTVALKIHGKPSKSL